MSTNYYHPQTLEHIRNPLPAVAEWATATAQAVPGYDPQTHQCRFVAGAWLVEAVPVPTVVVPQSVTMRQARLQLLAIDKLTDVETAVAGMGAEAQIAWDYSSMVERDHALVVPVQQLLGYTDAQMDELFIAAAKL